MKLARKKQRYCFYSSGDGKLYFEGDIKIDEQDELLYNLHLNGTNKTDKLSIEKRNANRLRERLWTDRVIPFAITPSVGEKVIIFKSLPLQFLCLCFLSCVRGVAWGRGSRGSRTPHSHHDPSFRKFLERLHCDTYH